MLPESHPLASAQTMLMYLFAGAPKEQYVEFRAIWDKKHRKEQPPDGKGVPHIEFVPIKDLEKTFDRVLADWIMRHNKQRYDIYFSVCPRRVVNRTPAGYPQGGQNEDVSHAVCAWMDYDKPNFDAISKEEPKPSLMVSTGHGAHCYWVYPEAVDIAKAIADSNEFKKKFGGDNTTDAARILRVPGTKNWKEPEKNLVATLLVEHCTFESAFAGFQYKEPEDRQGKEKKDIYDLPWDLRNVISSGYVAAVGEFMARKPESDEVDRSVVDHRVIVSLLQRGWDDDEIREVFFNKENGISAKVLEEAKSGNAENYFNRTLDSARVEFQKKSLHNEDIGDVLKFETWSDLKKAPPLNFVVDRVLPEGGMLLISGPAKTGKSFLVQDLALLLAGAPGKFMGKFDVRKHGVVAYCQAEIQRGSLDSRLSIMAHAHNADWRKLPIQFFNRRFDLGNPKHVWAIIGGLKHMKADYLIIDPLARFHREDENKQRDMSGILGNIERIGQDAGVFGTIVLHHHGKPVQGAEREGVQLIRGATVIGDWGNAHILLRKRFNKITGKKYMTVEFELRDAEEPAPFDLTFNKNTYIFEEYREEDDKLPMLKDVVQTYKNEDEAIEQIMIRFNVPKYQAKQMYRQGVDYQMKASHGIGDPTPLHVGADDDDLG